MDIISGIMTRRSIRAFTPEPVAKSTLLEIMETARRAPSSMNTQPWEIWLVTGEPLDKLKAANQESLKSGEMAGKGGWARRAYEGIYRQRQIDVAVQLYQSMGIAQEDKERRAWWWERGFRYFDAPAAIFLCVDESFPEMGGQFGLGIMSQTICLGAHAHGLGTCIEVQGSAFPENVREHAGIPVTKRVGPSIAIGYPDWDWVANQVISERAPLSETVNWVGFD